MKMKPLPAASRSISSYSEQSGVLTPAERSTAGDPGRGILLARLQQTVDVPLLAMCVKPCVPVRGEDGPLPMACWNIKAPCGASDQKDGEMATSTENGRAAARKSNQPGIVPIAITYHQKFAKRQTGINPFPSYAARAMKPLVNLSRKRTFDQQSMVLQSVPCRYSSTAKTKQLNSVG